MEELIFVFPQFLSLRSLKKKAGKRYARCSYPQQSASSHARFLRGQKSKIKKKIEDMIHLVNKDLYLLDQEATGLK